MCGRPAPAAEFLVCPTCCFPSVFCLLKYNRFNSAPTSRERANLDAHA
nr:MAG TPA: hypothetical protein [Caudoviricetes sp.]